MPPKLLPSVLDRLLVDDPVHGEAAHCGDPAGIDAIMRSVKRDLEWLLNTKRVAGTLPEGLGQLAQSLLTYGLPDFSAFSLSNPEHQARLRRAIRDAITRFEPRLSDVRVDLVEGGGTERVLRFQVAALLRADPEPVPVTFDSTLLLSNRAFVVAEG